MTTRRGRDRQRVSVDAIQAVSYAGQNQPATAERWKKE
jgi:hypothetical protein